MAIRDSRHVMVTGLESFCQGQTPTEGSLIGRRISRSKEASANGSPRAGLGGKGTDRGRRPLPGLRVRPQCLLPSQMFGKCLLNACSKERLSYRSKWNLSLWGLGWPKGDNEGLQVKMYPLNTLFIYAFDEKCFWILCVMLGIEEVSYRFLASSCPQSSRETDKKITSMFGDRIE